MEGKRVLVGEEEALRAEDNPPHPAGNPLTAQGLRWCEALVLFLFIHSLSHKCPFICDNVAGSEDTRANKRDIVISVVRDE